MFNNVRTFCSHSKLTWIVHFLQNLLTWSIVKLMSLPIAHRKFSLTWCSQVLVMACQSAISGTFKNISQAKARAPGVLLKVVATLVCMAWIAVVSASSIMSLAWVILRGGLVCTSVLSTLFTVWCIISQIALDCGFLLVEHTSLMQKISNSHWKFCLMNSPTLSFKHCTEQGYQQS